MEVIDTGKHSSLLQYGKNTTVKCFIVQARGLIIGFQNIRRGRKFLPLTNALA